MIPLRIERRAAADDEALFRQYAEVFGSELTESSRLRWRWQYLDNPANGPDGTQIWVAREGEALLGQYASMPVRLSWGGREVASSWGMDVFVTAAARGKGVGARLFTAWSDHVEVALGLGLTPSSYGLFRKLRYDDVGPVPFHVKVLDPGAVARRRLGRWGGTLAGPVLGLGLLLAAPERRRRSPVTVSRAEGLPGPEYDRLWDLAGPSYAMCVRRDAAYVRWKYLDCPHRRYDRWEARQGAELRGFAVSRHEDLRGLRLGWVVDLFAAAPDHETRDALLGAVLDDFRRQGVARAQAFAMSRELGRDLRRRGFLPGRSPMLFCVRSRVGGEGVLDRLGDWHVTFGDSDMDR